MSTTERSDQDGLQDPTSDYTILPQGTPYANGFNIKTLWAALFVGFVMTPGSIYLDLVTGQSISGAGQWVTIIMFIEVSKRLFVKLTPQETIILYWLAGGLSAADSAFNQFIWKQYLIQSPHTDGISDFIPSWVVPPRGSDAYAIRTFFHVDWFRPIMLAVVTTVLGMANSLSLGYMCFRITNDVERLPFPLAPVQAGGATALAESSSGAETWRWRVFSIGSVIGMAWGLVYAGVPTLTGILLVSKVEFIPIPFADFTVQLQSILPATPVGLGTDLGAVLTGFVLPFWVVVGMFMGSIVGSIILNPVLYDIGILSSWTEGMGSIPTSFNNSIDFGLSFGIGTALVVGFVGAGTSISALYRSRKARSGEKQNIPPPDPKRGDIRLITPAIVWAASTAGYVGLVYILIPDFPWWIVAVFGFLWTPFFSYIGARMIGLTGQPFGTSFPFVREGSFYLSGYKGAAIWFAPIPMFEDGGVSSTFKQLELTRTNFGSLMKLTILSTAVTFLFGFLFWSLIWKLAAIPSSAYPFIEKMWPLQAMNQTLWVRSTMPGQSGFLEQIVKWEYILAGFSVGSAMYGAIALFKIPMVFFYGFVGGFGTWIHYTLPTFVGAILGRYYFTKRLGPKKWTAYTPVLLAGYGCGLGLIGMTAVAFALVAKATEQIVF